MTQAVTYVEIDIDFCTLTYGTSPCTATLTGEAPTGTFKCFNSLRSCQDVDNFADDPATIRWVKPADYLDRSIEALPYIESVEYAPAMLDPGGSMGQRASVTITFSDHPHSDTGGSFDQYLADRSYDPWSQGTFWGKWRARHYMRGRPLRLITGTAEQALVDMETRYFVIESFEGPSLDGTFTITANDVLQLSDGDRSLAPAISSGSLVSGINDTVTSATLTPAGIGDAEYPASGKLNIGGKEVVSFTRSGDVLTITRAQDNTVAVDHDAGARCQICLSYSAADPADIIKDLLETYAGVDSSYIPISAWQDETAAFYRRVNTALITEPTPVNQLINELIEQCGLMLWWDDVSNEIQLQVLRQISTTARTFNDDNIIAGSLKVEEQPDKRLTRVLTYFGQFNPLLSVDERDNYRSQKPDNDDAAEAADGIVQKIILSRWIPFGGQTAATRVNDIIIGRFKEAPRRFTFDVARHNGQAAPILGDGVQLEGVLMQDATGARETVPVQIVRVKPEAAYFTVVAEEMRFTSLDAEDADNRLIIIGNNSEDLNLRTLHDALYNSETVAGEEVELTINEGVEVTASDTSAYGLTIGDWPELDTTGDRDGSTGVLDNLADDTADLVAGMYVTGAGIPKDAKILSVDSPSQVTLDANTTTSGTGEAITFHLVRITVNVNGTVTGKGGRGANGRGGDNNDGYPGNPGGDAFYTRYPILLNIGANGSIQSGGGGGGSGVGDYIGWVGPQLNSGGAGGGAGYGEGGSGLTGSEPGDPGLLDTGGAGGKASQFDNAYSGDGGDRGEDGERGYNYAGFSGGVGGAAGDAIDGDSYVEEGTLSGNISGDRVN